jgi:hypothetical protein
LFGAGDAVSLRSPLRYCCFLGGLVQACIAVPQRNHLWGQRLVRLRYWHLHKDFGTSDG